MADPYARRAQMFPEFTSPQLDRVARCGTRRAIRKGEILFDQGDATPQFFVVTKGAIDIVHPHDGMEDLVTVHRVGQFTGEANLLSGRGSMLRARVSENGEVIVLTPECLRRLVQTDSDLSEVLMRAFILRRMGLIAQGMGDAVLVGSHHSAGTLRIQEFLTRNGHPHTYLDVDEDAAVQGVFDQFKVGVKDVPLVICRGKDVLRNPTNSQVADCLGFNPVQNAATIRDLLVVGAGPAGLAAAVYAASEGLDTLVLESNACGGQAGSSSKIENYLGFPTGISGQALAGRAFAQAEKFGAEILITKSALKLSCRQRPYTVDLSDGSSVKARSIVIATGAEYRKPAIADLVKFEGVGVYYGATFIEGQLCGGQDVIVVGGGNSAGQAAVFLSGLARRVLLLVRSTGLSSTMSKYLIRRIEESPNITLLTQTQIETLEGGEELERVRYRNSKSGESTTADIRHVFVMTGATPNTEWLRGCLPMDDKGFIKAGVDLNANDLRSSEWPLARQPFLLETSLPGVFAVGDVRAGSVKRVASAVGEGAICVQLVHRALEG